jgi:hypothetical protein
VPIVVMAQTPCLRFPDPPNPNLELQLMLSHPNMPVCPSEYSNPRGATMDTTDLVRRGMDQGYYNTLGQIRAMRGY